MADSIPVLTFTLGERRYALLVDDVVEVAAMVAYTPLPESPPAVLGVANRHGTPLPLLDLRHVFDWPAVPIDTDTLFIVVQARGQQAGLVVDVIRGVEYVAPERFRSAPAAGKMIRSIMSHEAELVQVIAPAPLLASYLNDEANAV